MATTDVVGTGPLPARDAGGSRPLQPSPGVAGRRPFWAWTLVLATLLFLVCL